MFVWQNKKHELCVTFNSNKPVSSPDLIINEQSAKILQEYINENKPICTHNWIESYKTDINKVIKKCSKCGEESARYTPKDPEVYFNDTLSVNGVDTFIHYIEDPGSVTYNLVYKLTEDSSDIILHNTLPVIDLPKPTGDGGKTFSFSIPFHDYKDAVYAKLGIIITDKWNRTVWKHYYLDIYPYSRHWVEE